MGAAGAAASTAGLVVGAVGTAEFLGGALAALDVGFGGEGASGAAAEGAIVDAAGAAASGSAGGDEFFAGGEA